MIELVIRKAVREESSDIYGFIKDLAVFEKLEDRVVTTTSMIEKSIFDNNYAEVLFLEVEGKKIGFCLYFYTFSTFEGKPSLYLEDLFVVEESRNKGYGQKTLMYLANQAIQNGCARFEWSCLNWNKNAIDFYKKFGATPQNEWTLFRLEGENLVSYRK